MLYFIGLLLPPVAVAACGKPWQAIFITTPLTLLLWIPGVLHAWAVASAHRTQPLLIVQHQHHSAPPQASESNVASTLVFFFIGAGIAIYWMSRMAIFAAN